MIYPEHYTEQDKKIYDDFYSVCVSQVGQPKDYELYMFDINSKMEVSRRKGDKYVLTDEEQAQMARIWSEYGQPFISPLDANGSIKPTGLIVIRWYFTTKRGIK